MNLRFFVDHCISNYIIETFKSNGYEVFRLRDYISTDSADDMVISKAQELNCILVSLNGDFSDIVTYPPASCKGILSLQVKDHPEIIPQIMSRLMNYLLNHQDMNHYRGKLFLVEVHRIRVHE